MLMSTGVPPVSFPVNPQGVANPYLNPYMQFMLPKEDTTLTKIFVGGLPYHTSSKVLREFFEKFGEIKEAVVIMDKATDKSKGYGFVTMAEPRGAELALKEPNPVIDGRQANVNLAILGAKPKAVEHPYYAISSFPTTMLKSPQAATAAALYPQFQSNPAQYMPYPTASHITGMPLIAHPAQTHIAQQGAIPQTTPYFDYSQMMSYQAYPAGALDPFSATAVSAASGVYQNPGMPYAMALSPTAATAAPTAAGAPTAQNIQLGSSYQATVATQHQIQEARLQ